jgi:hypothetical protein
VLRSSERLDEGQVRVARQEGQGDVAGDVEIGHHGIVGPVLGRHEHAAGNGGLGIGRRIVLAVDPDLSACRAAKSEQALGKGALAAAEQAGDGDNLVFTKVQIERLAGGEQPEIGDFENLFARRADGDVGIGHAVAEHGVDRAFVVELFALEDAGNLAVAHRNDAVGNTADVRHPVRDVENGNALGRQPFDQQEQPLGF